MNLLFVIPSYNMSQKCYEFVCDLNSKNSQYQILIVDNDSTDTYYLNKLPDNIKIEKNMFGPTYEAGALLHAYTMHNYKNYFLLQDSIEINDNSFITDYISKNSNFILSLCVFCPAHHQTKKEHRDYIKNISPAIFTKLLLKPGITWNSFIAQRQMIETLINRNILIPKNLPKSKMESESWERIFGVAFELYEIPVKCLALLQDTFLRTMTITKDILAKDHIDNSSFKKHYIGRN